MHENVQYKIEHIFVWFYAGYGINVTGVNSREIIILFSMCRHAHSCAFISVIELPRIPAYCPKIRHYVAERSTFDDDTSYIIPGKCPGDTVAIGAALPFIKEFIDGIYLI